MAIKMHMPKLASVRGQTLLTDTKPYLYRQSPVVAEMLEGMIVGGTVAWNQQAQAGIGSPNYASKAYDSATGVTTVTPSNYSANTVGCYGLVPTSAMQAHKYLCTIMVDTDNTANFQFGFGSNITIQQVASGAYRTIEHVFSWSASSLTLYARSGEAGWSSGTFRFKNVQCFDLTQMFGTTIADYVYSLETQTAGSGIAWLKSFGFFGKDYYPYDSGSLLSVKTSAHKTVGKNILEPLQASNAIKYNGSGLVATDVANGIAVRGQASGSGHAVGFIIGNADDYIGQAITLSVEMAGENATPQANLVTCDGTFGNRSVLGYRNTSGAITATIPQTASGKMLGVALFSTTGADSETAISTYTKLQLEYGNTATAYEPYEEHVYPLDDDLELRGIPKIDENGNLYYDGDIYESNGTVTRKYGAVDLGTLTWTYSSAYGGFLYAEGIKNDVAGHNIICEKYPTNPSPNSISAVLNAGDKWITVNKTGATTGAVAVGGIIVKDSAHTDANAFKTAMSGVMLVYELATPTTESADAFENPQVSGTTEEYVDERTVPMPVGHTTEYFNMVQKESISMHMPTHSPIKMHVPKV